MAFAIANSCGEEGRSSFHRLCRISEKYKSEEADKLYNHALQQGSGANSLGTVFHLAERTGIRLDRKLANLQNLQPPHPHTRTREERKLQAASPKTQVTKHRRQTTKRRCHPFPVFPITTGLLSCSKS